MFNPDGFVNRPVLQVSRRCCWLATTGCDYVRGPRGITCEKLRALKVGMAPTDVLNIMGPPPHGAYPMVTPGPSPIIWNYGNESPLDGGVRLQLFFEHDQLIEASSWVRNLWRDLRDSGPRPTTFYLTADHYLEGREFVTLYCPPR